MSYSLRYTPQALHDMDAVWNDVYKASKSLDVAEGYIRDFAKEISAKKIFPFSGIPLTYRELFTGYYSVNFKKYKAFYRVRDGYIEVARIILSTRDYMQILFDETI